MRDELAVRRAVPRLVVDVSERLEAVHEAGDLSPSVLLYENCQFARVDDESFHVTAQ